jgi:hypothetical protein
MGAAAFALQALGVHRAFARVDLAENGIGPSWAEAFYAGSRLPLRICLSNKAEGA